MSSGFRKFFTPKKRWDFQKGYFTEQLNTLKNPSRGWYRIYTFLAEETPDFQKVWQDADTKDSLALVIINIGAYRESDEGIDGTGLQNIRTILKFFARKGHDIILRITYDHEGKALEREPYFFSNVQLHMSQLAPIVKEFAEYIFIFQGLLVGNWGEMHTSRFLDSTKLRKLWEILRETVGEEVYFAVRRPAQWRSLHPDNCGKKDLQYDKMGLFDDAIFGSESHLGTFGTQAKENAGWEDLWKREDELRFEELLCTQVPNGGEAVCGEQYTASENHAETVDVLRRMHVTYLNRYYDEKILELWRRWKWTGAGVWQGRSLYEYIEGHLGYRFCVRDVEVALISKKDRGFLVTITIENTGFANLYEEAEVLLEWNCRGRERYLHQLDCDLRTWNSGTMRAVSFRIPAVECDLYLFARRKRDGQRIYFANQSVQGNKVHLGRIWDVHLV